MNRDTHVNLRIETEIQQWLYREARRRRTSRSAIIREILWEAKIRAQKGQGGDVRRSA